MTPVTGAAVHRAVATEAFAASQMAFPAGPGLGTAAPP